MSVFCKILTVIALLFLCACAGVGNFSKTYRQMATGVSESSAFMAEQGIAPRLIVSENFEQDMKIFEDQDYIAVGESYFNGPLEEWDDAVAKGAELGVTHVLLDRKFLYNGSKKAYKTVRNYDYVRVMKYRYGRYYRSYEPVPDPISIPYRKNVPVYKQRAVYLVKLKK